eukprot:scaffold24012_cov53-Phaeocystis_antarctica.AAC.3
MLLPQRLQGKGRMGTVREYGNRKRTLWVSGALEVGDLRLLENGSERGCALVSDLIPSETVSEGRRWDAVREQACQRALTRKQTLRGR